MKIEKKRARVISAAEESRKWALEQGDNEGAEACARLIEVARRANSAAVAHLYTEAKGMGFR